jgi:hypothetical protein
VTLDDVARQATALCDDYVRKMRALIKEAEREGLDDDVVLAILNTVSLRESVSPSPSTSPTRGFTIM